MKYPNVLKIAGALAAVLAFLVFASCGNQSSGDQAQQPKSTEPVTITFMHFKSDVTDAVQAVVNAFEAENPNIKVEVQPVKFDSYYALLKTKFAGGDVVDVFTLNAGAYAKSFVDGGYVEDLSSQPFLQNFDSGVLASQATDGKNYLLPVNAGPIAVFYNKKIFKDLGIEVPRTSDALFAAADKIKKAGKTPFALGWKDVWTMGMWLTRDLPSLTALEGNNLDFFEKLELGQAKFADNPYTLNTIAKAKKLFDYGNKDQFGVDYNGVVDLFAKGDVAMMYMGTWPLETIKEKNPDLYNNDLGYFPYPFSNTESLNNLEFNPDASLALHAKSTHKEAALKFLAFMASTTGGNAWVDNVKSLSYVKGTRTDIAPALADLKPYFDQGQLYNSQLWLAKTSIDWGTQFAQNLANYLFKRTSAEQVVNALDTWVAKNHK